jgi:kumamolisin
MTKTRLFGFGVCLSFALGSSVLAVAQYEHTPEQAEAQATTATSQAAQPAIVRQQGTVIVPQSSVARPEDAGKFAHTNHLIFVPAGRTPATISPDNTFAEYPASLACVYKVGPQYAGCVPANNGKLATGGWGAIALVDAYDNPNAASDLAYFSSYFLLHAPRFVKVYANSTFGTLGGLVASCGGVPPGDTGWGLEEDLDIEWAHAMAPSATIILVEACSNSYNDLLYAEYVAGIKVAAYGGGEISNSWSSGEFSGETGFDAYFHYYYWQRINYFASAGDAGWGAGYPSSSPWVISAGGTTVNRDASGNFLSESCWAGSGGGVSSQELWQSPPNIGNGMGPWTDYQYPFAGQNARQTPDLSFDADPASGAWVYDTYGGGPWYIVGGTSLSSPALAGIVNSANNRLGQAPTNGGYYNAEENNLIYSQLSTAKAYASNFYDVTTGSNGSSAGVGYDQCTGVGSPRGKLGK